MGSVSLGFCDPTYCILTLYDEKDIFLVSVLEDLVGLYRTSQLILNTRFLKNECLVLSCDNAQVY